MLRNAAVLCLGATFLIMASVLIVAIAPADPGIPHRSGEVIIKFKSNASDQDKNQVRAELGGYHMKGWGRIQAELRKLDPELSVEEAISRYRNHPKVEYIEPNYIVEANETPNDPLFGQLWGMENTGQTGGTAGADISATTAWDVFTGSGTALIGVIDTGVDYTHPDLAANIYTNPGEVPGNGIDDDLNGYVDDVRGWDFYNDDNDPMDDHGHGSHVSGTIGGVGNNGIGVAGVCWTVKIMPLKFLSASGSGSTADAVDAVEYATMMGVNLTSNSWGGGGFSQALFDAINAANTAGILFVAAAGNSGANTDVSAHYPSSYALPNIISVAATDDNDQLASFSNYGATTVDLAAPGVDILSTFPGNTYGSISGTSMATPHVSGALGLVFGRFPAIGHLDAKNLILNFADPLPNLSGVVATGGRLNAFFPIADPDSIPPGAVTDLAVDAAGSNWLIVDWTAPGDDGYSGTASRYIVKYSATPIDALNFDAAMTAPNPPDPEMVGTMQDMKIAGLDFSTTYYVAMKAVDEFGNASGVSNLASGTTLGAPDIDVDPTSLSATLLAGATTTQTLTLYNVLQGTLDFEIPVPDLITLPPLQAAYVEYGKDETDPRVGDPVLEGTGGPDSFGYRWVDSDEPFGPTFDWTDISGTGTMALSSGDDSNVGPFPIGFPFSYYGVEYNSFRICSNGFLSFTSSSTAYSNQPLPNAGAPANMVAPFWDDLNLTASGEVYYESDGSRLIVQWNNAAHYDSGSPYTFQAILNADGSIVFQYLTVGSPDNSATVGIQNASGTDALQVVYNTAYAHDNLAIKIQAVPQWITVTPTSGTVYAGDNTVLNVDYDSGGLLGGTYDANVRILSNDPDEPTFTVPVTLTVIGAPDIAVAPGSFDFGEVFIGATPTTEILVQNPGTDSLHVSSISIIDAAYTLDLTSFTVPPRQNQPVNVTFAPIAVATYPATMTILSDDPDEPSVTVSLTGAGVVPPDFSVTPTSLSSNLLTGETETQVLTLGNAGGADLEWSLGVEFVAASQLFTLTAPEPYETTVDVDTGSPDASGGRSEPIQAELNDLTGVDILWDRSNGQATTSLWTTLIADFTSRGATLTQSTNPITPGLLEGYEVLWCIDTGSSASFDPDELSAIASWMSSGGGLLLEGDNTNTVTMYNQLLTAMGAGFEFSQTDGSSGVTANIHPHETTQNVTGIYLTANTASIPSAAAPGGLLFDDDTGVGAGAYSQVGAGRIVAVADEVFQNSRMDDANNQLFGNQVMDWLAGAAFLSVSPTSGTVPPGGNANVDVLFDATDLFGGLYEANINIETNDPLASDVAVPVDLQVTGAPDLVLDPASTDFGVVYVGYPDIHEFVIFNSGTDLLTITSITSDEPAFSAFVGGGTFPINLNPLASTVVQVRFSPPAPDPYSGNLTIYSNDPDTPQTLFGVTGSGLLPPLASVDPDSLHADLLTNETEIQQFTVYNTGDSDLEWSTQFQFAAPSAVYALAGAASPSEPDGDGGVVPAGFNTDPVQIELADLTGIDILWDRSHGQSTTSAWTTIIGDFEARGATVTVNTNPITPTLLQGYDVFWSIDTGSTASWDPAEITALVNWINAGGGLLFEGDNTNSAAMYNDILAALGAGIEFTATSGASGTTTNIFPHTTTNNVAAVYLTANVAILSTVTAPAAPLVDDVDGVANTAYTQVGAGRVIATADETFGNSRMGTADNRVFGNQVMDWLATPVFLSVDPKAGVIPPGGNTMVAVTFDAGGLFGGNYSSIIRVLSNDPAHGELPVAATLTVTGVPGVAWEPEPLDFGDVFLGYPDTMTLVVSNPGTDDLMVTSMTPGLPDWSVSPATFMLHPLETAEVSVSFDPQAVGDRSTALTIVSNDPDSPHTANLSGYGLLPPAASVDPDSLHADLLTGEIEVQPVTLSNTGDSDLFWETELSYDSPVLSLYSLAAPEPYETTLDVDTGSPDPAGGRTTPIQAELADLTGVAIMWDRSHGQSTPSLWTTIISDFESRGATLTENSDTITPELLAAYDVIWSVDTSSSWDPAELAALADWMSAGGGLLLEGDNASSVTIYNGILTALGAGITFTTTSGADGITANIYPHETTKDVTGIYLLANVASIPAIVSPGGPLFDDVDGVGAGAYSQVGGGRVVAIADEVFQSSRMDDADNQLFGNQVMDWLSAKAFLAVYPESGTVPAGGSALVDVTFDATGLYGGDYSGHVRFLSNDPVNGVLEVPATMHVTPVPRVAWEPESLDFGDVFIGYPADLTLTLTNIGTDVLSVTSLVPGLADYSVDVPSFDLDPLQSQDVVVTFDPQAPGVRNTDLAIMSNDPDSPHAVPLAGVGVVPPVITASPDTVEGAALPGGSKTKTLTLCNGGGSDLIWSAGASANVATQVYEYLELPKGEDVPGGAEEPQDPRPSIRGTGGPDMFGYTWIDSDEPGGPAFDWVDISAIGNPTDFPPYDLDGTFGPYPIGFTFPFYENAFDSFYVSSEGWISFTNGSLTTYTNQPLPNSGSSVPENLLAIWWDDNVYDESDGSYVVYYYDGTRLIIESFLRRIGQGSPPYLNFEIILYPNGDIVYQYNSLAPTINSATIGWQNATKDDGQTVIHNDGTYPHTGLAILISAAPEWLTVSPESGVLPAGECIDLDVLLDAAELEAGDYTGSINITSNDPAHPMIASEVVFHVGTVDAADFDVDPNTLNLGAGGNWITARVELPTEYDPADVLVETVRLNGAVPADVDHYSIGDFNMNAIPDLEVRFDRGSVNGILAEGDSVLVTVTGEIEDTIYFVGMDYVRVIRPQLLYPTGGEAMKAGSLRDLSWANPEGYAVDYATLTFSPDGGNTWSLIADNVTAQTYRWTVPTEPADNAMVRVYISDNRGIMGYATSDPFSIASSVTGAESVTPTVYALMQNAPNPFVGATRIAYDLPEDSKVELKIFDVSGRMVRILENRLLPAGGYEAVWDGRDAGGRDLASGIYFYRLETAKYTSTKRMFLMK
jgi:subtilisin family serine protease